MSLLYDRGGHEQKKGKIWPELGICLGRWVKSNKLVYVMEIKLAEFFDLCLIGYLG